MLSPRSRESAQTLALLPALLIAAAMWLLTRPYHGIWHDGRFYAVQALHRLYPERYAQDVFFLYGSQDDFTLFGAIQAWLSAFLGVDAAVLLLVVTGAALWLYALLQLLRRWLSALPLAASAVLVLALDSRYAGFDLLSYGEGFATPRVHAEALVLLALSWWFDGRRRMAWCAVALAGLLHPLIALAGVGVFAWALLRGRIGRPALLWLALLSAGLLGLQFLRWSGLSPWLDPAWKALVELRSPFVFPQLWPWSDWLRLLLDVSLLWLASRHLAGEPGRLAAWVLPVLALAILWSLAAGALGVQLAVAAQLQRVQWLAHLLALALALPLCLELWRAQGWERYLAVAAAASLVFPLNLGGLALPVLYGLYRWACFRFPGRAPAGGLPLVLSMSIPLTGLALWLFYFAAGLSLLSAVAGRPPWLIVLGEMPVAAGLLFLGHAALRRVRADKAWPWLYGAGLLAVGALYWDVRKPWSADYGQPERAAAIAPVQAMIPDHAVVYWESAVFVASDNLARLDRGVDRSWFWLRRANYASFDQAAGSIFYRETAMETARRAAHLRQWGFRDGNLDWQARVKPPHKLRLSPARLHGVCADPVLDYVITDSRLAEAGLSFVDPQTERRFSVYDCRPLRQGANENGARQDD
jgi:hypothetical protein